MWHARQSSLPIRHRRSNVLVVRLHSDFRRLSFGGEPTQRSPPRTLSTAAQAPCCVANSSLPPQIASSKPMPCPCGLLAVHPGSLLMNAIGRDTFPDRAVWKRNKVRQTNTAYAQHHHMRGAWVQEDAWGDGKWT